MSGQSLLSKRLSGIICDPVNLNIKPVARSQVQAAIDDWESRPSPNIATIGGGQEPRLGSSLPTTLDDHKEVAALGYNNMVGAPNTLLPIPHTPLTVDPFPHFSYRIMSNQDSQDVTVAIKAPEGDSLLNAANEMINICWGTDKEKDKDIIASAQFFFGESGNNLIIRKQCSPKDKDEWNNCN